jgi:hypothetical protein
MRIAKLRAGLLVNFNLPILPGGLVEKYCEILFVYFREH